MLDDITHTTPAGVPASASGSTNHTTLRAPAVTPAAECIATGDRYLDWALRCYATLSDRQIAQHLLEQAGIILDVETPDGRELAWAVARHAALMDVPASKIAAILGYLAVKIPAWPDDPEEIEWIAKSAVRECAP